MADKNSTKTELQVEYDQKNARVNEILDAVADAEPSKAQLDEIDTLEVDLADIQKRVKDLSERGEKGKEARQRAADRQKSLGEPEHRPGQGARKDASEIVTLGDHVNSELKEFLDSYKGADGLISTKRNMNSPAVKVDGLFKSIITGSSDNSAGAFITTDRQTIITDRDPFRVLNLRDLMTNGTTTSDTVSYAFIADYTNNAAPVGEATDSAGTTGTPNESSIGAGAEEVSVKDISHFVTMSKRAVADAGQIKMFVDNFLLNGLGNKVERLCVNGDGLGDNFKGVLNTPNIQHQAFVGDILKTVRKARTKLKTIGEGYEVTPNALVMNAEMWEEFDLLADDNGAYRFGGPQVLGNPRVWGTIVVENEAMPDRKGILADWRYAALYDRMAAELTMSDSPNNYFLRKLVAVMGSLRAAFAVLFPQAFVEIDFGPAV